MTNQSKTPDQFSIKKEGFIKPRNPFKTWAAGMVGAALIFSFSLPNAIAGPFILSGTDADDHGSASATTNFTGWLFMQKVLENLAVAPSLTNGNFTVVNLGSSGTAATAAASAFSKSSLPGTGWSFANLDGTTALNNFFAGIGTNNINNTGIIMMDSGFNVGGGSSAAERAIFTTNAVGLDNFLGSGGGLFSQSNGYGWVSALLPSLTTPSEFDTGITLTAAGSAAFPGLTSAAVSAGPYHNYFDNMGGLTILGTSNDSGHAIIIGSAGGSVTNPNPVPEPGTMLLLGSGLVGLIGYRMKKARA